MYSFEELKTKFLIVASHSMLSNRFELHLARFCYLFVLVQIVGRKRGLQKVTASKRDINLHSIANQTKKED